MTEKELISKLSRLKNIKPKQDWVILTKSRIFETAPIRVSEELNLFEQIKQVFFFVFSYKKPVLATSFVALIFVLGSAVFVGRTLPGDNLYAVKRMADKIQSYFVSPSNQSMANLEAASQRLDDLLKIAQEKKVNNIKPTIDEFKASISSAAKNLTAGTVKSNPREEVKKIIAEVKKIEANKQKVESLGIKIGDDNTLENALKDLVAGEIAELEKTGLTGLQMSLLDIAKKNFENKDYTSALENILTISQPGLPSSPSPSITASPIAK